MKLYVIFGVTKKVAQKLLKESGYKSTVLSWSELLSMHNKAATKKKDHLTDEMFSLQFDTCLTSSKGNPGLKQCIFIISEEETENFISDNFNLLETNPWT